MLQAHSYFRLADHCLMPFGTLVTRAIATVNRFSSTARKQWMQGRSNAGTNDPGLQVLHAGLKAVYVTHHQHQLQKSDSNLLTV